MLTAQHREVARATMRTGRRQCSASDLTRDNGMPRPEGGDCNE